VVGLIGPIAGGKSVILETLARCGAATIKADDISRELLVPGSRHLEAVVNAFGRQFLGPDGELKRKALGAAIFEDARARRKLNRLLHPAMVARMRERLEELEEQGRSVAVIEAANLVEMGGLELVDRVVMVTAPREERLRRLMARDGISRSQAERVVRVHEEMGIEETEADYTMETSGKEEETRRKAELLWRKLVEESEV